MTTPEFSRPVAAERIGAGEQVHDVRATEAECAALAARFGIPAIRDVSARIRLWRGQDSARGEILGEAAMSAAVTQVCVITLDAFEADWSGGATWRFVREGTERDEPELDDIDEIPYSDGAIDLGEAVAEQIALDLDPYPRKPGAEIPAEARDQESSAFDALRALARRTPPGEPD